MSSQNNNRKDCATVEWQLPLTIGRRKRIDELAQHSVFNNFFQSAAWLNAIQHEHPRLLVSVDEADNVVAYSVLTASRSILPIPEEAAVVRGPIATSFETMRCHTRDLLQLVKNDYASIRINPYVGGRDLRDLTTMLETLGFANCKDPNHYQHTVVVAVEETKETQWRSLRRSVRTAINKAKRLDIAISHDTDTTSYGKFSTYFSKFAKVRGIAAPAPETIRTLQQALSDNDRSATYLLSARSEEDLLGQMLLVDNGQSLAYEWGWSETLPGQPRIPVMHSLVWKALQICRDEGISHVDLGGYWVERGPDDPNNHFKLGFSKSIAEYCAEYEYILSDAKFALRGKLLGLRALLRRPR